MSAAAAVLDGDVRGQVVAYYEQLGHNPSEVDAEMAEYEGREGDLLAELEEEVAAAAAAATMRAAMAANDELLSAAYRGEVETLKALCDAGADVNQQTAGAGGRWYGRVGNTALHDAAIGSRNTDSVKVLLAAGADVNIRNGRGRSALMEAAAHEDTDDCCADIVKLLLAAGAVTHFKDKTPDNKRNQTKGKTAYDLVRYFNCNPEAEALLKACQPAVTKPKRSAAAAAGPAKKRCRTACASEAAASRPPKWAVRILNALPSGLPANQKLGRLWAKKYGGGCPEPKALSAMSKGDLVDALGTLSMLDVGKKAELCARLRAALAD